MKKRLLSAVLALVLCAYPAMAADFGTLTISPDREVIDDSVLYELAAADEPSTLTLRTPDGETGSLTFDGTEYHLQPCGQTDEFTYSVLFSADSENAYGLPYTEWFMADSDIGQHIFDPVTEWDARHICSVPRWRDCGTLRLTGQNKLKPPYALLTRFFAIHRDRNAAISLEMQPALGQPLFFAYHNGTYTLTETDPDRFIRTEWTQLVPLPTNDLRTLSLTLINASGEQRPLFTFENPAAYLTLPSIV